MTDADRRSAGGDAGTEQLRESAELLALLQEAGHIGIFEWNVPEGTVRLSQQFLSLFGIAEFDGRYESWLKHIYREDMARFVATRDEVFAARATEWRDEFRIVAPTDGALKWIEARHIVFYDGEGNPTRVVAAKVDVTERKRAQIALSAFAQELEERVRERTRELEAENEARKKAEEQLRQAQKMEAVGQLTGGVAHDFNNLLTIVLGGLDLINRQIPSLGAAPAAQRIQRARDMALQGVQRAVQLTQRLLAFSRQQPLAPVVLDPNKLVATTCELLRRTLGESVTLETVLAGGLWRIKADSNQLENALINLALNARDAMRPGGRLTVETANCALDEDYIAGLAEPVKAGQYVMIAVTDTGTGMATSVRERAFDPFFTTKDVGKGTGLGLSQVYGFVRQSEGHVKIYSEVGEGTTVKVYLRRHSGADGRHDDDDFTEAHSSAAGAECVLVVEDDETLRLYTIESLAELGYTVLGAANGADALAVLNQRADVDLLFTDIVMPGGINGRQLADAATARHPGLKVLFTTGYARNAIVHEGRLDPGVQMLMKPYSIDQLGRKVRAILDGES